jgi:hypothetical protein
MGRPGKRWKVELTRKNVSSIRIAEGSGEKPGITGLTTVDAMIPDKWMTSKERHDEPGVLLIDCSGERKAYIRRVWYVAVRINRDMLRCPTFVAQPVGVHEFSQLGRIGSI